MARATIEELKSRRLAAMSDDERADFEETYDATRLALEVGERVRDAREAAGSAGTDGYQSGCGGSPRGRRYRSHTHDPAEGGKRPRPHRLHRTDASGLVAQNGTLADRQCPRDHAVCNGVAIPGEV